MVRGEEGRRGWDGTSAKRKGKRKVKRELCVGLKEGRKEGREEGKGRGTEGLVHGLEGKGREGKERKSIGD